MIKKIILPCLLFLLLVTATGAAFAAEPQPLDDFTLKTIAQLKARESTLQTFEARFDQIQKSSMFEQIVRSRGIIRYDARGKFLFKITDPAPYAVVFDGDYVYIHDPSQSLTKKHRIGHQESILKKYFGIGQPLDDLKRRFGIKASSNAPLPGITLVMKPKETRMAKRIALVSADVNLETWLPSEIYIQQPEGDWTRMQLVFTAVNQPLGPDAFKFKDQGNSPSSSDLQDR
jgi:outer membrane lipoprotein-sorting protein